MTTNLEFDPIGPVPCVRCGGEAYLLGVLGTKAHFRCRACGWVFPDSESTEVVLLPLAPEEGQS